MFDYSMHNQKSSDKLLSITFSITILVLLSLFIGNVSLLLLAVNLNDQICAQAAHAGARSYVAGGSQQEVQSAVFNCVNKPNVGGYFISHPALVELRFYVDSKNSYREQMLSVRTITGVHVPAPFLLFFAHPLEDGAFMITANYRIKLKEFRVSSRPD